MKYDFDSCPGFAFAEEAEVIYDIITMANSRDILEAGCYTGKLTLGIANKFPEHHVHAIDRWDFNVVDNRILPHIVTIDTFKHYTSGYLNITSEKCNFFDYHKQHDILILSLDTNSLIWQDVLNHASKIAKKYIIGRHNHLQEKRKSLKEAASRYGAIFLNAGVYYIKK